MNEDIAIVVEQIKNGERELPEFDMLVGGFPCQDYSVAKPASMASGIDGKKGVLWWSINSILEMRHPSRTILTSEGGRGASRTKHVVMQDGRLRRLVPDELDQLQCFPKGWTNDGMTDGHRAFCMGNALVTEIPHRLGRVIAGRYGMK